MGGNYHPLKLIRKNNWSNRMEFVYGGVKFFTKESANEIYDSGIPIQFSNGLVVLVSSWAETAPPKPLTFTPTKNKYNKVAMAITSSKKSLLSLINEYDKLRQQIDNLTEQDGDEESTIQFIFDNELVPLEGEVDNKVNSWCWAISGYKKDADYYAEQAKKFQELSKQCQRRAKLMNQTLKTLIVSNEIKVNPKDFRWHIRKGSIRVAINKDYPSEDIPDKFKKVLPIEEVVNKTAVKAHLLKENELPFANLEMGESILVIR